MSNVTHIYGLAVSVPNINNKSYITVEGVLTHQTSTYFIKNVNSILERGTVMLTIGCKDLKSIDGSGVAALVLLAIHLKKNGQLICLRDLNGQPLRILYNLGLTKFFKGGLKDA